IVCLELARPAVEPHQDDRLAVASGRPFGPQPVQVGERKTREAEKTGLQCGAAGDPRTIAGGSAVTNLEHTDPVRGNAGKSSIRRRERVATPPVEEISTFASPRNRTQAVAPSQG